MMMMMVMMIEGRGSFLGWYKWKNERERREERVEGNASVCFECGEVKTDR